MPAKAAEAEKSANAKARTTAGPVRLPTAPSARLEARISADLHGNVKRAAALQGRTVTDFVVYALQEAATEAIAQADLLRLTAADQEAFAKALLEPPKPKPALKRAFARAGKLLAA